MTRTDVMASSRPGTEGKASRRRRVSLLLAAILTLLMAVAFVPAGAVAAEETNTTSGYGEEPKPKEKEEKKPAAEKESKPAEESEPAKAEPESSKLPFTGFDLRWSFAVGVLLIGSGVAIVVVQRRQRRDTQR